MTTHQRARTSRRSPRQTGHVAVLVLGLALTAGCDDLFFRAREAIVGGPEAPASSQPGVAAVEPPAGPAEVAEARAEPVVLDRLASCMIGVAVPLRSQVAQYLRSAEISKLQDGKQIRPPEDLRVQGQTCRRGLEEVAQRPCSPALAAARDRLLAELDKLTAAVEPMSTYYRSLAYMDDSMAQAGALHERLLAVWQGFQEAHRQLETLLIQALQHDLSERRDRLRDNAAKRHTWLASQVCLSALRLRGDLEMGRPAEAKHSLAIVAKWIDALRQHVTEQGATLQQNLATPDAATRFGAAATAYVQQTQRAIAGRTPKSEQLGREDGVDQAFYELLLSYGELR